MLTDEKCWCESCRPITMDDMRMVICPACGNKRCPHAADHRNQCTGSNAVGQIGSSYQFPAHAIESEVLQSQEPVKLLDSVKAFIQDGINDATQCDDADADHDFALCLGQLLNPLYLAPQPPAPCQCTELRAQVERLTKERDEADLRAGAAERRAADELNSRHARESWLRKAKKEWGTHDSVSFDVVWREALQNKATISQQAERIAELEHKSQSLARSVIADQTYDETRNMFHAAILDLAAINEALDCDPDDGGAVPIIEAIDELKETIAAQSAALAKALELIGEAADDIETLGAYASEYFQAKHNLLGCVARYRNAIAAINTNQPKA